MRHTVGWILVAFSVSCSGGQKAAEAKPAEPPEAEAETAEQAETTTDSERTMLGHWVKATRVRDHITAGDLEMAKTTAGELASGVEQPPQTWAFYITPMDNQTAALRSASSLEDAAMAAGKLGATCGDCHTSTQANVQMTRSEPPPVGDDPRTHMQRHQWAVNAMWEGLVGPSDGRWSDGLGVLAEKPLHGREAPSGHVTKDKLELLGEKVHDLGVRGTGVPHAERAAIFGELVSTCASCHAQTLATPQ